MLKVHLNNMKINKKAIKTILYSAVNNDNENKTHLNQNKQTKIPNQKKKNIEIK